MLLTLILWMFLFRNSEITSL